jgi:hypothetical protein
MTTLYDGDTFEHAGNLFRVTFPRDEDHGTPWDEEDGHGPVTGWESRDKRPGEMILSEDHRGRAKRFYDFAEAVRIAKAEGWDAPPYKTGTAGERAHRAALADFDRLRRWCSDDWCYVGCVVTLVDDDEEDMPEFSASFWGIESDAGDYLREVAEELADEILSDLRARAA